MLHHFNTDLAASLVSPKASLFPEAEREPSGCTDVGTKHSSCTVSPYRHLDVVPPKKLKNFLWSPPKNLKFFCISSAGVTARREGVRLARSPSRFDSRHPVGSPLRHHQEGFLVAEPGVSLKHCLSVAQDKNKSRNHLYEVSG